MRQSTGIERDTELVLAARNGDPWARDQLITAHLPLIHTTVALAMNGRHGVEHVEHVVRETMLRALDGLDTLTDPGVFRPWLVAIAVDGIRRHRHAQPAGYAFGDVAAAPCPRRAMRTRSPRRPAGWTRTTASCWRCGGRSARAN